MTRRGEWIAYRCIVGSMLLAAAADLVGWIS